MKRISPHYLYYLGSIAQPLKRLNQGMLLSIQANDLLTARGALGSFAIDKDIFPLPATKRSVSKICDALDSVLWDKSGPQTLVIGAKLSWAQEPGKTLTDTDAIAIRKAVEEFEIIFDSESNDSEIWAVKSIDLYSSRKLIDSPEEALDDGTRLHLWPTALADFREAAACMAFGRFTASGFHSLRSLESVIKQYVLTSTGTLPPANRHNWGEYLDQLKKSGATNSTISTLHNIKDNHRNPLMHPEDVLDDREAVALFQLCGISIGELVKEMLKRGLAPAAHP